MQILSSVNNCCNRLYDAGAKVTNWMVQNGRVAKEVTIAGAKKVAALAVNFFAALHGQMRTTWDFAKTHAVTGYKTASQYANKNPRVVMAVGVAFALGSAVTAIALQCWKKTAGAPAPQPAQPAAQPGPEDAEGPEVVPAAV